MNTQHTIQATEWITLLNAAREEGNVIWLNANDFVQLKDSIAVDFDPVTTSAILQTGIYGWYRGMAVCVSRKIVQGTIFVAPDLWYQTDATKTKFTFDKSSGRFYLLPGTDGSKLPGGGELKPLI